ncbi:MAG: response regulator [Rhodospirillaceae bacterium]|nr:response regulator [Rhodospirillaceae bacterium]
MAKTSPVISRRLFAALGVIMLSVVIVGTVSILALMRFQASYATLNTVELPTLTETAHISRLSASIAERGAGVIVAPTEWARISEIEKIRDDAAWLDEILNSTPSEVLSQARRASLLDLKQELIATYNRLTVLSDERIQLDRILSGHNDEIHLLQEDLITFQYSTNLSAGKFIPSGPIQQWTELIGGSLIELSAMTDAEHQAPLNKKQNVIVRQITEAARLLSFTPKEAQIIGGAIMERVQAATLGPNNVFEARQKQLQLDLVIEATLEHSKSIAERFLSATELTIIDIKTAISEKGVLTGNEMTLIVDLVVGLIILSMLIAIVTFYYINRTVLMRLNSLRLSMLSHVDGEGLPIDTSGNDEIAEMANSLGYFVDAIHTREEGLRHAKDDAEHASVAKTRFLAAASHDLRQPLQALNLFVFALAAQENDPEKQETIKLIRNSLDSLKELLNTLLDISKLEAGVVKPNKRDFDVGAVLERITTELAPVAWTRDIELRWVPSSARVFSDPLLVETILRNLVDNAIKYAGKSRVVIGCRHRADQLKIEVWDGGVGIAEDQQDLIFQDYYQIENEARQRSQGLGLGLSIVRRLARLLDCDVGFSSQPGRGTGFWISVPLSQSQSSASVNTAAPTQPATINGNEHIAIIDDDESVVSGLVAVLERSGYSTRAISHLEEQLVEENFSMQRVPDLIIADYRLDAGLTGQDAIELVRKKLNTIVPAIIITGDTAPERLREAKESGFEILHKPVSPEELLSTVQRTLQEA